MSFEESFNADLERDFGNLGPAEATPSATAAASRARPLGLTAATIDPHLSARKHPATAGRRRGSSPLEVANPTL